jgi:cytochrome P450 family 4
LPYFGKNCQRYIQIDNIFFSNNLKVIKRKKEEILQKMSANNSNKNGVTIEETMNDIGTKRVLAFLDNLLTQNIKDPQHFTEYDVRAEVDTFMSAGQDTSSATVQFSLQLIGHYPEVQVIKTFKEKNP